MHKPGKSFTAASVLTVLASVVGMDCAAQSADTLRIQRDQYEEVRAKSILELQPFRRESQVFDPTSGLHLNLTSLNPAVGAWYLLQTGTEKGGKPVSYHIENPMPDGQELFLETGADPALVIRSGTAIVRCKPWVEDSAELARARETTLPYAPICDGKLFLRNKVPGSRTNLESAAEFLRENIWGGESIVRFVRDKFFKDSQLETSDEVATGGAGQAGAAISNGARQGLGRAVPIDGLARASHRP